MGAIVDYSGSYVACHGEQGVSVSPDYPHLNGQSGMTGIANALEEPVIADVAAYYAGQPKRNPNPATLGELPDPIVRLVELGDPNRNIPPCAACHRPGLGGPIETPILSEQGRDYLAQQLRLYASGERRNDVYARMRAIAARLTPAEIDGLSRYCSAVFVESAAEGSCVAGLL
jgi:cytochrome c553